MAKDFVPVEVETELAALVRRHDKAGGLGLQVLNALGGQAENLLERLPDSVKDRLEDATLRALEIAHGAAAQSRARVPDQASWLNTALATALGAAGGFGGLPAALTELPVTTTLLLRAIQAEAARNGFDPEDAETRLACLEVFAAAGPLAEDDGANMAFLATRVTLTGATVQTVMARIAPQLARALGQKLAAQTVPVLGAAAGAATNYAYTSYYQEMAAVHFGLKRLARDQNLSEAALTSAFRRLSSKR